MSGALPRVPPLDAPTGRGLGLRAGSLEEAVIEAVNLGDDADTAGRSTVNLLVHCTAPQRSRERGSST